VAVAEILRVIDEHDGSETALDEVQRIAGRALNEPTKTDDYWHGWLLDLENFNTLPQPMR
jgi:hypothetical protein